MRTELIETILINRESYFYLDSIERKERGCKPITKKIEDKIWEKVVKFKGMATIDKYSFGGGDGTYDGKWWSWDIPTVKKMLTDAGYTWKESKPIETVYIPMDWDV